MPIAYVLINSDLGTDVSIITKIKEILTGRKTMFNTKFKGFMAFLILF